MGIDANIYAQSDSPITDGQIAAAISYVESRNLGIDWDDLVRDECAPNRINFCTSSRYYSPGYERGYWPDIYAALMVLGAAFPGCTIHYGGDHDDDCLEFTPEDAADMWAHWLGPNWDDYHERRRNRDNQ